MNKVKFAYYPETHEICAIREDAPKILEMFEVYALQDEESALELARALNRGEVEMKTLFRARLVYDAPVKVYCPRGAFFPVESRM